MDIEPHPEAGRGRTGGAICYIMLISLLVTPERRAGGDWGKCGEMGKVNTTIKLVLLGELLSTLLGCKWDQQRRF